MKKSIRLLALGLVLALSLCGCMGGEVSQMFALPQPPEQFRDLSAAIGEVIRDMGGESTAPTSGSNTQNVQLQDLDGDGSQECAITFLRVSGAEKPLKIVVFRAQGDEGYAVDTLIEGVGSAINSVSYENVGGGPEKELVVSWQISATDHTLGVYSLEEHEGIELMWVDSYSRFRLADLDADGEKEVVVLTLQTSEEDVTRADYYDYDGAALALKSTASLSANINEIKSIRGGYLVDGVPAVFVTSSFVDNTDQVVDILACREGALTNISLASDILLSAETVRAYTAVSGTDINVDGVMELPKPILAPKGMWDLDDVWFLQWRQFDLEGTPHHVLTTYHNVTDGWYFQLPEEWEGRITVSRKDSSSPYERGVVFSLWMGEDQEAAPFFTLYKLTGSSQAALAGVGRREVFLTDDTATYACEFNTDTWDTGLTPQDVKSRFHIIRTEWSTEN